MLNRSKRNSMGVLLGSTVLARTLHEHCTRKASLLLEGTFSTLFPALITNHVFTSATGYRAKVRVIQRAWRSKS